MSQVESIDVERLRWFVAVAEELHFARAAKGLGIARQRLSRTVIDLETELGTKLFVPGAQPTQLTDEGRELLAAAREVIARREVAEPELEPEVSAGLRVGFVPGVTVSKWERIWGERFPEIPLRTIPLAAADQLTALREGRVDMCFVRLPIDRAGLSAIPLYREVPVVVVPKEHPISLFTEVTAADLADERMQDASDIDAAAVTLEMVAAGVGLAIVPHSIARLHARRDLVYRTVTEHPDTEIALAWPTAETTELVEEFVGVVRGRSERSSRSPSAGDAQRPKQAKKPASQKKTAAGKSATPARGARSSGAKKPGKRRGR
ncbi:LysR family transcriptional regulator [Nocardia bhagyanarayanae]|uniref:DNA-binding transcriptional LysR family regulator n=1 Tax=Nocardia bhagyanarayanae TaxID=1215925 RepID=A0A543FC66_9NOCA|nr:LysR substrate-binding domain-containing protein [Nocardia bhagyanarayanae]TQM31458.1 DNA-binding transcriptional LysR family regulator [Nocardia bhagyanarayanae]